MQKRAFKAIICIFLLTALTLTIVSAAVEDDFLQLINAERAIQGRTPLVISSELTQAAQLHSQDMMNQNYFSHTSLNGDTLGDRIRAAGYDYLAAGENIAWHTGVANASRVFEMWRNSPGHYSNMISNSFEEIGLGFSTGSPYQTSPVTSTVYTLDLGRRATPPASVCSAGENQTQQCGTDIGACEFGTQSRTCNTNSQWSSWSTCQGAVNPTTEICDQQDNNCNGQVDENQICEPLELTINTPEENQVFLNNIVVINATLNKISTRLDIYDNNKRIATCFNCASFQRAFSFSPGQHSIIINATSSQGEIAQDTTQFSVIVSDLNLISVDPRTARDRIGKNATFIVNYRSDLPISAMVHISSENYDNTLEQSCPASPTRAQCIFNLMLPEGLNETAALRYHIMDETNTEEENAYAFFDTINPQLTLASNTTLGTLSKRIRISGILTEKAKVTYFDQARNRTRNICSRCDHFTRTFTIPINNTLTLPITIKDLAGNQIQEIFELN
jgi:hypothetical protein